MLNVVNMHDKKSNQKNVFLIDKIPSCVKHEVEAHHAYPCCSNPAVQQNNVSNGRITSEIPSSFLSTKKNDKNLNRFIRNPTDNKILELKEPCSFVSKKKESDATFFFEILIPFLLAGCGMVGAGILLDNASKWEFLTAIPEALVLIPALLGLKGNLEMTLASRLSTIANLGQMDKRSEQFTVFYSNLALVQTQAIVVALVASFIAVLSHCFDGNSFDAARALTVMLASTLAASVASFFLTSMMVLLAIFARKTGINPDNITTPLAAATGDVISLSFFVLFGTTLYRLQSSLINLCFLAALIFSTVIWVAISYQIKNVRNVLKYGWFSVFFAMLVSSCGGYVLKHSVDSFPTITLFQPIINGVGGNLVAVQASKISTSLHRSGTLGSLHTDKKLISYFLPSTAFMLRERESVNATILLAISLPGHCFFFGLLFLIKKNTIDVCPTFLIFYIIAAIIQVSVLLYICQLICRILWILRFDPDNNAIPLLTALGDLIGTCLLVFAFALNQEISGCELSSTINFNTTLSE